ncbi:MAG: ring-opening amidohydrolase [Pseudomonadota bacterium]
MPRTRLHVIPTSAPDDVSGLEALIEAKQIDPGALVAILGKTEGNGCVNDFTRAFAIAALKGALGPKSEHIAMVMSGGTEGGLSPHLITFERLEEDGPGPALAIGTEVTGALVPEELGTQAQIRVVAAGVESAMARAGIASSEEVHFVQVKCPLLTAERIIETEARGQRTETRDTLKSMALSRGASALGVALALGEIDQSTAEAAEIGKDPAIWSGRASCSAGSELMGHEILVMGMSADWTGPLTIDHCVMADTIDTGPVAQAMARLQIGQGARLAALLAKAEASSTGAIRGTRHTMLDDSDISATRHARAFVGGALAGLTGQTDLFISGGAEHQGPDGGGPVAVIAERRL